MQSALSARSNSRSNASPSARGVHHRHKRLPAPAYDEVFALYRAFQDRPDPLRHQVARTAPDTIVIDVAANIT